MSAEKEKIKGEYTGRWNARFTIISIIGLYTLFFIFSIYGMLYFL